jgi:hypothetical protein
MDVETGRPQPLAHYQQDLATAPLVVPHLLHQQPRAVVSTQHVLRQHVPLRPTLVPMQLLPVASPAMVSLAPPACASVSPAPGKTAELDHELVGSWWVLCGKKKVTPLMTAYYLKN